MIHHVAMTMRSIIAVFLVSIAFVSLVLADDVVVDSADDAGQRYVPAAFANGLDAAAAEIPFPKYKKDFSLNINCAARVSEAGQVESYFCLDYRQYVVTAVYCGSRQGQQCIVGVGSVLWE